MKTVVTASLAAQWMSGEMTTLPSGPAIITPSGRDVLRKTARGQKILAQLEAGAFSGNGGGQSTPTEEPVVPDHTFYYERRQDPVGPEAIRAFFHSDEIQAIKEKICDIGRRVWQKNYVDGNGGNITVRVGHNLVLSTPTLISKGFMSPDEICLIDLDGKQLAGRRKRTSEAMTHLAIMKRNPKARSCVHAHPPHATAFAIAHVEPPTCLIPEAEVFLGKIGMARYETPGSPENAAVVGEVGKDHQAVLMLNHGVITWGDHVEDAYWKMENTDAYCQTVWVASQLGNGLKTYSPGKLKEILNIRQSLGMEDNRLELKECELCNNDHFQAGTVCDPASRPQKNAATFNPEAEELVKTITAKLLKTL